MDDDSGPAPARAAAHRYVQGVPLPAAEDPEQLSGRSVAEDGARTASQDRGEPASLPAEPGMADRVDATVEQMQVSTPDQALDLLGREASCEELPTADDSVLAGGELGRRVGFGSHMNPNPPQLADAPS